jgi:hypothetical protein
VEPHHLRERCSNFWPGWDFQLCERKFLQGGAIFIDFGATCNIDGSTSATTLQFPGYVGKKLICTSVPLPHRFRIASACFHTASASAGT